MLIPVEQVALAALISGPIIVIYGFIMWRGHRIELETGEEPKWFFRWVLFFSGSGLALLYLSKFIPFLFILLTVTVIPAVTGGATALAIRWIRLRRAARR